MNIITKTIGNKYAINFITFGILKLVAPSSISFLNPSNFQWNKT